MLGLLVIVVLLLVIMPVLLYLVGWGVTHYTKRAPDLIGSPISQENPGKRPDSEAPARRDS